MGKCIGEEGANWKAPEICTGVPLSLLLSSKWSYIENPQSNYWTPISRIFCRNYIGMGGVEYHLARDVVEPLEHAIEIPEGLQLSRKDKLALE